MMGMVRTDISRLQRMSNVRVLGHMAHDDLPAYLHYSDVLLLPYRVNTFSQYINPAKLFECLASGKPIIATNLPIFEDYRRVVDVAVSDEMFESLVVEGLKEERESTRREERRACARVNTWEARFAEINALVEGVTGRK
jgi:glycosyltransferase involved in cell wall biosynthesis